MAFAPPPARPRGPAAVVKAYNRQSADHSCKAEKPNNSRTSAGELLLADDKKPTSESVPGRLVLPRLPVQQANGNSARAGGKNGSSTARCSRQPTYELTLMPMTARNAQQLANATSYEQATQVLQAQYVYTLIHTIRDTINHPKWQHRNKIRNLHGAWKMWDVNGHGALSEQELADALERTFPTSEPLPPRSVKLLYDELNLRGNGVSHSAFSSAFTERRCDRSDGKQSRAFHSALPSWERSVGGYMATLAGLQGLARQAAREDVPLQHGDGATTARDERACVMGGRLRDDVQEQGGDVGRPHADLHANAAKWQLPVRKRIDMNGGRYGVGHDDLKANVEKWQLSGPHTQTADERDYGLGHSELRVRVLKWHRPGSSSCSRDPSLPPSRQRPRDVSRGSSRSAVHLPRRSQTVTPVALCRTPGSAPHPQRQRESTPRHSRMPEVRESAAFNNVDSAQTRALAARMSHAATTIQTLWRRQREREARTAAEAAVEALRAREAAELLRRRQTALVLIQSKVHARLAHKAKAATQIQRVFRVHLLRQLLKHSRHVARLQRLCN